MSTVQPSREVVEASPKEPTTGFESFRLTRWFAGVTIVSIGLLAIGLGLAINGFFTDKLIHQQANLTSEFVGSLVRADPGTLDYVADATRTPAETALLAFKHISLLPDVVRMNVYDLSRTVIWSSDPELMGRRFGPNQELDEALSGEVVAHTGNQVIEHGKSAYETLRRSDQVFLEVYIPLTSRQGSVIGAIEFYKTPRELTAALSDVHQDVLMGGVVGSGLLSFAAFGLIRRADKTMRRQHERLLANETLVVIGEMSAVVAHSIRNPLSSIRTSAELMQCGVQRLAEESAADIIAACDRLEGWVKELLSYTQPIDGLRDQVDLAKLVDRLVDEAQPELSRLGLAIETDFGVALPHVNGNELMVGQVVRTLLTNAIEASRHDGVIRIQAHLEANGDRIALTVSDNGQGMTAAQLKQVGQPFFTTKVRGLGVGLALARRVIDRLGGVLEFDSIHGRGTWARLRLPVA